MLERLRATRVVATPEALDRAVVATGCIVLRIAPDEALIIGEHPITADDPHAIVVDDAGWCGAWLSAEAAERFLRAECQFSTPPERPALAQGMVAGLPVKLWLEAERTLFVVPHVFAHDLQARMTP